MKKISIIFFLSLIFNAICGYSLESEKLPYYLKNKCPGQFCSFGEKIIGENITVYKDEKYKEKAFFSIKENEKIDVIEGNIIILKHGIVKINEDIDSNGFKLKKDDSVYLLYYEGENFYQAWINGKLIDINGVLWQRQKIAELKQKLKFIWSIKIKNKKGQIGWIKINYIYDPERLGLSYKEKIGSTRIGK